MAKKIGKKPERIPLAHDAIDTLLEEFMFECGSPGLKIFSIGEYMTKNDAQGPDPVGLASMSGLLVRLVTRCKTTHNPSCS